MMVMCRPLSRRLLGAMVSDASSSAVSCGPAVDAGYECVGWSTLPVITPFSSKGHCIGCSVGCSNLQPPISHGNLMNVIYRDCEQRHCK